MSFCHYVVNLCPSQVINSIANRPPFIVFASPKMSQPPNLPNVGSPVYRQIRKKKSQKKKRMPDRQINPKQKRGGGLGEWEMCGKRADRANRLDGVGISNIIYRPDPPFRPPYNQTNRDEMDQVTMLSKSDVIFFW